MTSLYVSCQGTKENESEVAHSIPPTLQQCTVVYAVANPAGVIINSENATVAEAVCYSIVSFFLLTF